MSGWLDPPMECIPEESEGECLAERVLRRREVFTSEQVDTLVSTVPQDRVPHSWVIAEEQVVDPCMASSYLTEALADPASARSSSYTYTYESHFENGEQLEDTERVLSPASSQGTKVTRVTKVTTTRSLRQIPVDNPYGDLYFDSDGQPVPEGGIALASDRSAPPPAPPLSRRYSESVPDPPGVPLMVESDDAEATLCWTKPADSVVLGYLIEMRDYPDGDWESVHDHLLPDTSCTITNLDCAGLVQFRVSAAGKSGFSAPSPSSAPVALGGLAHVNTGVPLAPGRPVVVGVDGNRASVEWTPPPSDASSPPIAGYHVEYRVYGTTDWITANDVPSPDTRYQVENLRPNGVYEFRVRARNEEGVGTPSRCSAPAHIKPAVPTRSERAPSSSVRSPGQPQVVEADMNWVKLEWPDAGDGIEYVVELREVGDLNWYQSHDYPIRNTSIHVEGLRPGSTYEFRVFSSLNGVLSLPSEVSDIVSLRPLWKSSSSRTVPSKPSCPEYVDINGDRITLCWVPTRSGLPVIGYDIEFRDYQQDSGWYKVNDAPMTACKLTIGDLIVGHEYEFRVLAQNAMGWSEPSDPSLPVTIQPSNNGEIKFVEAERFGAIRLLQEEMIRESPPLPDRDDSPPPIRRTLNGNTLQWRDPNLKEVIDYLDNPDIEKQKNASGYLQHLTFSDNHIKEETRELGGIPKLVRLLASHEPSVRKNAAACLKNICFGKENERNKVAVVECDGVGQLTSLLGSAEVETLVEVTAALWNLSSSDALKVPILDVTAVPLIQKVVLPAFQFPQSSFSVDLFKNSTGILRNMSAANASARVRLRDTQLIDALLQFLQGAIQRNEVDSASVENVVCILRNLSYRIQEVEDPNYDPAKYHDASRRSRSAPSGSPKMKKKSTKKGKEEAAPTRAALLWQQNTVRMYLKLLQEASNLVTLEACAGAVQNLAACEFVPSAQVRSFVRVEKGLPILVELVRLKEDHVVCAVVTALRNLSLDERNRELIGKYALRDLLDKLPEGGGRRATAGPSDQTISAVLGILFEIVRSSAASTRDIHDAKGTDRLRALAKAYPMYSRRVCKYASQVLYAMWQHKELHDGFKRSGLKEADFYSGTARRAGTDTLARPISSQGRERPHLNDTHSSDGSVGRSQYDQVPEEPLYASVRKADDSWV